MLNVQVYANVRSTDYNRSMKIHILHSTCNYSRLTLVVYLALPDVFIDYGCQKRFNN